MYIKDLLSEDLVCFDLKSKEKYEAINELVSILEKAGRLNDSDKFRKDVLAREAKASTGIGREVAIPHSKSDAVIKPSVVFAKSKRGIDFESIDGKKVKVFFMIAVPMDSSDVHLEVISEISRKIIHPDIVKKLLKAKKYQNLVDIFS